MHYLPELTLATLTVLWLCQCINRAIRDSRAERVKSVKLALRALNVVRGQ